MSREDKMTMTILEDGTARLEVDGISGANHVRADALVAEFAKLMGGKVKTSKRPQAMSHTHHHGGQTHKH